MKIIKITAVLAALIFPPLALAGKVVVFDVQQAILQTNVAKQRGDALQSKPEFALLRAEGESLQAELEALAKEAESKGLTWSPEVQAEHRKKMEFIQADLQLIVQKIKKEQDDLIQGLLRDGQAQIPAILNQLVQSEGIDIILRKDAAMFAVPEHDITPKVIAELNKVNAK